MQFFSNDFSIGGILITRSIDWLTIIFQAVLWFVPGIEVTNEDNGVVLVLSSIQKFIGSFPIFESLRPFHIGPILVASSERINFFLYLTWAGRLQVEIATKA